MDPLTVRGIIKDHDGMRGPSPVAQKALAWIAKLYGIEADIKASPPDQKADMVLRICLHLCN